MEGKCELISFLLFFHQVIYPPHNIPQSQSQALTPFQLFEDCLRDSGIPEDTLVSQNSNLSVYNHLNYQWNLRIPMIYPLSYFLPKSSAQVQSVVKCGAKFHIPLIPKSGGHSYESFSFGSSETVVVDLRYMNKISVETQAQTATIESGALIGQINEKLWKSGGFGLPLGDCLTVGIGGYILGGGYGYLAHAYGLAIDNLLEAEMVDAAGDLHTVSQTENQELFWALRGIGSGFIGIVTKLKFKMFAASELKIQLVRMHYDLSYSAQILKSWQEWIAWSQINAPHILGEIFFLGEETQFSQSGSSIQIDLIDVHHKFQLSGNTTLTRVLQNIFPLNRNITTKTFESYMDFLMEFAYAPVKSGKSTRELNMETIREDEIATQRYVKQKTFFVDYLSFNFSELHEVGEILSRIPQKYMWVDLQSDGGVLDKPVSGESSYVHRKASYSIIARYEGPNDPSELENSLAWLQEFERVSKFMDNGETYQNYVDRDLKDHLQRYYGTNLPKLIELKRKWDPANYFRNPQSLPIN